MANPFVKAWKYLMALFSSKVDEYARPEGTDPAGHRGCASASTRR